MVQPAGSSLSAHYPQGVQQATALQPGSQGQQQILVARPQLQQQTHPMNRPRKCRCYLFLESLPNRPRIVVKHVLALIHPDFNDSFAFMIFFVLFPCSWYCEVFYHHKQLLPIVILNLRTDSLPRTSVRTAGCQTYGAHLPRCAAATTETSALRSFPPVRG